MSKKDDSELGLNKPTGAPPIKQPGVQPPKPSQNDTGEKNNGGTRSA